MPLTNWSKDNFVAPELSKFTSAAIRDMSAFDPEQTSWLANYILNSLLRGRLNGSARAFVFNFIRRTQAAASEYQAAREATLQYLDNPNAISSYVRAIDHWEAFVSAAWHALCLLSMNQKNLFEKGDGSVEQRLNLLYNETKHAESVIASGSLPESSTMCVWLANEGLYSVSSQLTFDELAHVLQDLGRYANALQDPPTIVEKLQVLRAEMAAEARLSINDQTSGLITD